MSTTMTWEQKAAACQALGSFELRMRKPGDWYVGQNSVEVCDGYILSGGCVTGARTPEDAVEAHWLWLTKLKPGQWIVIDSYKPTRRAVLWNGFMWEAFDEKRRSAS